MPQFPFAICLNSHFPLFANLCAAYIKRKGGKKRTKELNYGGQRQGRVTEGYQRKLGKWGESDPGGKPPWRQTGSSEHKRKRKLQMHRIIGPWAGTKRPAEGGGARKKKNIVTCTPMEKKRGSLSRKAGAAREKRREKWCMNPSKRGVGGGVGGGRKEDQKWG